MKERMMTFDTFVEDHTNRFAAAACKAVSEKPAEAYDPLWIHGPSGCGKSHLLSAVCRELEQSAADVCVLSGEDVTNAVVQFCSGRTLAWKRLESCGTLVLQNVDFLLGKNATQDILAELIVSKCARHQQVLISSSYPPTSLGVLYTALRAKTERHLFAEIAPPDPSLRRRVARRCFEAQPFPITKTAFDRLIEDTDTLPQLQGALNAARLYSLTEGKKITLRWAKAYIHTITR